MRYRREGNLGTLTLWNYLNFLSTILEPSSLFFFGLAGSILGPSYARSPISSQAQLPALAAAFSILHLRKQYRLQAPTLILQTWQTEEQEENGEASMDPCRGFGGPSGERG
ncbi:hypothetical protein OIU79_027764 [Salix purpurea]|uniref:Uncharacterized protein n=1 Tax=Salix purpurea TaxID=77065 RepID=A0A9Q0VV85_SALPP|nr:hypothetical protein OIU79_027764 [Salix purpurea]